MGDVVAVRLHKRLQKPALRVHHGMQPPPARHPDKLLGTNSRPRRIPRPYKIFRLRISNILDGFLARLHIRDNQVGLIWVAPTYPDFTPLFRRDPRPASLCKG